MIRFFQTGIIFIYFVLKEEAKSLTVNDHISRPQLYLKTDMFCDLPDLDWFRFKSNLADLECLRK